MVRKHHGKWRYEFEKNGIRHRKGGFKSQQDAAIAEVMARKNLKGMNTDFIKLCESRLKELETRRTDKWFKENRTLLKKKLTPLWGKKKEITRSDVESFLNDVAGGVYDDPRRKKRDTKRYHHANSCLKMIRALFRDGMERGLCNEDPTINIKKFPVGKNRKYIPPIEDIKAVLTLAKPMDKLYLLVLAHSMGRVNAINQLRWIDVHDNHISLYTRKARNSDIKEIVIPMNEVLRESIKQIPKVGEFVFFNPKTCKPYVYRKRFLHTLCKKAGVQDFTFHCIRHFTASLLDNKGVSLTDIQKLLGHERATTTDIYLQSLKGSTDKAIKKLEEIK